MLLCSFYYFISLKVLGLFKLYFMLFIVFYYLKSILMCFMLIFLKNRVFKAEYLINKSRRYNARIKSYYFTKALLCRLKF
jgi:hypothetical protein